MHNSLLDVIKYVGDNNVLVHRDLIEDFNSKSQLIVDESQEAIFYKDGQALDLFGPGRHTLTTQNLPLIRKLVGKLFGGKTPYPVTVYFINKVYAMDVLWGTDSPIALEDPKYGLLINVRSNGSMAVQVEDSRRFVVGVVGQLQEFTVDEVKKAIKGAIMMIMKNAIANAIAVEGVSILEINAHLEELSAKALTKINEEISRFGIKLAKFYVNAISCSETDLQELKEAKARAASMIIEAQALARSREIQGYDYRTERSFDVMEAAASNEGGAAGTMIGAGVGLGVGLGVGGAIGDMTNNTLNGGNGGQPSPAPTPAPAPAAAGVTCPNCGQPVANGAKFCSNCGTKIEIPAGPKFCPECGTKLEPGTKFCPNCGTKIE